MKASIKDIPEEVRIRLVKEGKLPAVEPKRQTMPVTLDKTAERLSVWLLDKWRNWCLYCGIVCAGLLGMGITSGIIALIWWAKK